MLTVNSQRLVNRLAQLVNEIQNSSGLDYHDRLRELKRFCESTPSIANIISQLPEATYDFSVNWRYLPDMWPGGDGSYGMRWNAIKQMVEGGPDMIDKAWLQLGDGHKISSLPRVTDIIIIPIANYLIDRIEATSDILYVLLRYKRWSEWFKADNLRTIYLAESSGGEDALDENIRKFLFESGIDYPFSQPASPRGRVDIVAGLESDDPLVLEIKVWDSTKSYRENRIRDGLRQAIDYAIKYGKDLGYIVVFNLDESPLSFVNQTVKNEWPPRLEHSGRTFYFIDVHISEKTKPISQQDKGKPVKVFEIKLNELLEE